MSILGWKASAGLIGVLALLVALSVPAPSAARTADLSAAVVVQAADAAEAEALVLRHGGQVDRRLDLIGGVAARVSAEDVGRLVAAGARVVPDTVVQLSSADLEGTSATALQLAAMNPGPSWSPEAGSGVGVALLDTGVAETPDLVGRVIHGPDYSDEGDGLDRYGHGTFMAGLIAGDGSASTGPVRNYGAAPGAHIVSLKLAGRDGVTSLSRVLDGIGWVVVNADTYGIRVMNLSIGVPTKVAPQADPLSAAVEAAWASGIAVVAASGNEGSGVVTSPGRDPWVITVGSTDSNGTATTSDDTVPSWSGSGRVTRTQKPELLAPGASVVSLRAPGSLVDDSFPEARIEDAYFRGSGTSMSTALVSGAVAALAEERPWATPDDLKGALVSTAGPVEGTTAGAVDLAAADAATATSTWRQTHPVVFNDLDGRVRNGMPWSQASSPAPEETWARTRWVDGEWTRTRWVDGAWVRTRWVDGAWVRTRWVDDSWARTRWVDDASWARTRWVEANFARTRWVDAQFARTRWVETDWARTRWVGIRWAGDDTWARTRWVSAIWEGTPSP